MRARTCANEVVSEAPPYRRATTYKPCERCGDGAIVWDDRQGESRCSACGSSYTGPSKRRALPC